jgi:hypothetical protein
MSDEQIGDGEDTLQQETLECLARPSGGEPDKKIRAIYRLLAELNVRVASLEVAKSERRVTMLEGWVDAFMQHLAGLEIEPILIELESHRPHLQTKNGVYVKPEI